MPEFFELAIAKQAVADGVQSVLEHSRHGATDPGFSPADTDRIFRLWLPKALGGPELSPVEFMRVVEVAAEFDGSVGWLVGNGGGMSRIGGYIPELVAHAWFADPHTFVVSATGAVGAAIPAEGGYRITGRWPFGSGAPHATHFMGLARLDSQPPQQPPLCCYMAREQVTVHDTWHVSGLRGTSSSDWEVRDAFVSAKVRGSIPSSASHQHSRACSTGCRQCRCSLGRSRSSRSAFSRREPSMLSRAACDLQVAPRHHRPTARPGGRAGDGRPGQGPASCRASLPHRSHDRLELATDLGGEPVGAGPRRAPRAGAHAAESALRIVDMLAADAGATAIFLSCPLERAVRDIQAAVKHVAMSPASYALAGRLHLDLDPGTARS